MKETRKWQLQGQDCVHLEAINVSLEGQTHISCNWMAKYLWSSCEPWFWTWGITHSNFTPLMKPVVSLDSQLVTLPWVFSQPCSRAGAMSCQCPSPPAFSDVAGWRDDSHSSFLWSYLTTWMCVKCWRIWVWSTKQGGVPGHWYMQHSFCPYTKLNISAHAATVWKQKCATSECIRKSSFRGHASVREEIFRQPSLYCWGLSAALLNAVI